MACALCNTSHKRFTECPKPVGQGTGWPAPVLLQDNDRGLFRWLANRCDSRRLVRETAIQLKMQSITATGKVALNELWDKYEGLS